MPINHTKVHYALGVAALGLGLYGVSARTVPHDVIVQSVPAGKQDVIRPSRHAWPSLGEDKTIALGEALADRGGKVTIFCASVDCLGLQRDLDDAFQIAGWQSSFEDRQVDSEQDAGIFVGPPGKDADDLAAAIREKAGLLAKIVDIGGVKGVGIIIGKSHE